MSTERTLAARQPEAPSDTRPVVTALRTLEALGSAEAIGRFLDLASRADDYDEPLTAWLSRKVGYRVEVWPDSILFGPCAIVRTGRGTMSVPLTPNVAALAAPTPDPSL